MAFLQGVTSLPCRLVHHTGTIIRFTTGQLGQLPLNDEDCFLELPDGAVVRGYFRRHPDNPYIGGSEIVRWIKVDFRTPRAARAHSDTRNAPTHAARVSTSSRPSRNFGLSGPEDESSVIRSDQRQRRSWASASRKLGVAFFRYQGRAIQVVVAP